MFPYALQDMELKDDLFSDVHEIEQSLIAAGQEEGYK
jgi:hypothetical protein